MIHLLGGKDVLGFELAIQVRIVPLGVEFVVQCRDPRDPEQRIHKAPFTLPTNAVTPKADAAKAPQPL